MNKLIQTESFFFATKEDLETLKNKDHARLLTISDSHGNYKIFLKIILRYGPDCDALIFCGDGTGDLMQIIEQAKSDEEIKNALPPVITFVRGNGDSTIYPDRQILTANHRNFFITHGHEQGVYFGFEQLAMTASYSQCSVGVYGHTHISRIDHLSDMTLVNPGSISRPRGGDSAGFAIITVEKKFIDTAFIKISNPYTDTPEFKVM